MSNSVAGKKDIKDGLIVWIGIISKQLGLIRHNALCQFKYLEKSKENQGEKRATICKHSCSANFLHV